MVNQKAVIWPLFWAGSVQWGSFSHLKTYNDLCQFYKKWEINNTDFLLEYTPTELCFQRGMLFITVDRKKNI